MSCKACEEYHERFTALMARLIRARKNPDFPTLEEAQRESSEVAGISPQSKAENSIRTQ